MAGTSEGGKKAAQTREKKGTQSVNRESRVEGGRKAAKTRGQGSLSEAGRKGEQH